VVESTKQGIVQSRRAGGVSFWACLVSAVLHLLILSAMWVTRFSAEPESVVSKRVVPAARVSRPGEKLTDAPIVPKPRMKKRVGSNRPIERRKLFSSVAGSGTGWSEISRPDNWEQLPRLRSSAESEKKVCLPYGVEFFNARSPHRKVCYVVDCSGSMKGSFAQVRQKLIESVRRLENDHFFDIVFFGGDRLAEFGQGRLVRASRRAKAKALEFINSVEPAGQTNAKAALERALQIPDSSGNSAAVIYFLTDGFELSGEDAAGFAQEVASLRRRIAPTTKITTIGFWPTADDRWVLCAIATESGGEFVTVGDGYR